MPKPSRTPRPEAGTPVETAKVDKAAFLLNRGWLSAPGTEPWSWYDPRLPASRHTLEHAYDIVRAAK